MGSSGRLNLRRVKAERSSLGGSGDASEASGLTSLQHRAGGGSSLSVLRNKVSPSSEQFDAAVYLGLIHAVQASPLCIFCIDVKYIVLTASFQSPAPSVYAISHVIIVSRE